MTPRLYQSVVVPSAAKGVGAAVPAPPGGGIHCDLALLQLRNLLKWYTKEFKDPLLQDPPVWFKSFLFCELVFQLPFFPIATYAFFRGW